MKIVLNDSFPDIRSEGKIRGLERDQKVLGTSAGTMDLASSEPELPKR